MTSANVLRNRLWQLRIASGKKKNMQKEVFFGVPYCATANSPFIVWLSSLISRILLNTIFKAAIMLFNVNLNEFVTDNTLDRADLEALTDQHQWNFNEVIGASMLSRIPFEAFNASNRNVTHFLYWGEPKRLTHKCLKQTSCTFWKNKKELSKFFFLLEKHNRAEK